MQLLTCRTPQTSGSHLTKLSSAPTKPENWILVVIQLKNKMIMRTWVKLAGVNDKQLTTKTGRKWKNWSVLPLWLPLLSLGTLIFISHPKVQLEKNARERGKRESDRRCYTGNKYLRFYCISKKSGHVTPGTADVNRRATTAIKSNMKYESNEMKK